MVSDHYSLSSCLPRRLALLVVGVLVATGLSVAPDLAASASEASGSRASSVAGVAGHAGAPRFEAPKPNVASQRSVETWTPVSHSVTDGERTQTTLYAAPAFGQVAGRWTRLSTGISRHSGRYSLRANGVAVPTWFGMSRNSLMRVRSGGGGLDVNLSGASGRSPRLVRKGQVPRIAYASVMPGVDLTYDVGRSSTKERIVLRDARAPQSFTFLIRDREHTLGTPQRTGREAVVFGGDAAGGFAMSLAEPVAYGLGDSSGRGAKSASSLAGRATAHQKVTRTRDGYRVRVWLDKSWAQRQQFPIVLDPTMVYSWEAETLATAYGPKYGCSSYPLASNEDGSAFVGADYTFCTVGEFTGDWFDEYVHANLSNIPPWTEINSASLNLGWEPSNSDSCYTMDVEGVGNLLSPGDSWDDSTPGPGRGAFEATEGTTLNGYDEFASDVTDGVREWVESGTGSAAGFRIGMYPRCTRPAAEPDAPGLRADNVSPRARTLGDPTLGNAGLTYDVSLTIDYNGPILPPPIPASQSYGCNCDWFHGADRARKVADPVNTALGQALEQTVDVAQTAPGVPAAFARTYNGGDDTEGPLGTGWTFNFDASMAEDSLTGDAVFRNPSGGQIVYHPAGGNTYAGDPGARGVLVKLGGGGWKVTSPEGETLTFNTDGQLISDTDRLGRGITLGYTGSGSNADLSSITDEAGQVTTLTYGTSGAADGKIVGVETDDGRTVSYDYATVDGSPHLTAVEDVTGQTTAISYDATTGRLDGITDPTAGESAQNVYDGSGRIIEQTDANGETTTFDWQPVTGTGVPDGSGIQVTTDPLGITSTDLYYGNVLIKSTDNDGNATSYTYDSDLNLVAVADPLGQVTTIAYDTAGNMLTRTGPAPSEITESWTYNSDNQLTSHTDGRGKTTTYDYVNGQLETVTDPLSHETGYTYDGDGNLATLTTPEGRVTSYDNDAQGNLTSQTSPGGHETTWTYDDAGNQTSMTSANGNQPAVTPADYTTTYTHDDAGRILTATDPHGTVTATTYDESGRLSTSTVTDDATNVLHDRAYTYDDAGNLLTTQDFTRSTVTNTYDERGQLATSADADGNTASFTYDYAGRRAGTTSPRGNEEGANPSDYTTWVSYDQLGNLYATATPYAGRYGIEYSYAYTSFDENNRTIAHTSGANRTSYASYDDAGNVVTLTDPNSRVTSRSYDDAGRLTGYARPAQDPTTYAYDGDGLRLSETSPSGDSMWSWAYADDGRIVTQVDARGNAPLADPEDYTTTYDYDAEAHLTSTTDQLGQETTRTYDALGHLTSSTDPRGKTTTWTYDAGSRLTEVTPPGGADPTTYDYDQYGDLITRADALGHETTYTYDNIHQVTSATDPLDRVRTYEWDADGNLATTVTARGNALGADPEDWTITQQWDPRGELTERTISNPVDPDDTATYQRDPDGLLTNYTDAQGNTALGYNDTGQLTSVELPDTSTYAYTYNDTGDIATRTYPASGTIGYDYNTDGLINAQISDSLTTSYSYDLDKHLTQIGYPSSTGLTENRDYDRTGRISEVTTIDTTGPSIVDGFTYTRDPNGNPTQIDRTRGATTDQTAYTYNDRNWLTKECPGVTTCTSATDYAAYSYDDAGNRTQMDRVGTVPDPGTTDYTYDNADQLTTVDDGTTLDTLTYDADGNLTTGARAWNALNQMTASNTAGTGATTYTYDALGNRTTATTGATTTGLSWDINSPLPMLAATTAGADQTAYRYTPLGELLQTEHPDETYPRSFHSHDALGSITDTFKTDGTPTVQNTYDGFGNATPTTLITGAVQPNIGYTSGYTEPATGETHLRARDYNPQTGRFHSTDPVPQNPARSQVSDYLYVENQPLVHIDPSGLCWGPDEVCDVAEQIKDGAEAVGGAIAEGATNHAGGCSDHDLSDCGWFFTDLVSLGGIEAGVQDASGCSDHDKSDCAWLFVDLFTAGVGAGAFGKLCKDIKHLDEVADVAEGLSDDLARLANQHVTNSGDTVLGRYPGYITKANAEDASYFDIGEDWDALAAHGQDPWALNQHFLDGRIAAGDRILLSTPKGDIVPGTYLAREVQYLISNGYRWTNQWSLRPGG
jgi:RHS repeat-associated protein